MVSVAMEAWRWDEANESSEKLEGREHEFRATIRCRLGYPTGLVRYRVVRMARMKMRSTAPAMSGFVSRKGRSRFGTLPLRWKMPR